MKKKLKSLVMFTLILTLINTGFIAFLTFESVSDYIKSKPVVISRDYDKGQSFQKALLTEKPIIVWFYADWCGYCQKFAPTFKKLTKDKAIKKEYAVAYVNGEEPENKDLLKEYDVHGYPTVYMVKNGSKKMINAYKLFLPDAFVSLKVELLDFLN